MNLKILEFRKRNPLSAKGKFYVDGQCQDCDVCRELAPSVFTRCDSEGISYIAKQPVTKEEFQMVEEVVEMCSEQAIRSDGLKLDWDAHPPFKRYEEMSPSEKDEYNALGRKN